MSERDLPPGVDPHSRCRLPLPHRDDLDERGRAVYDQLADPDGDSLAGLQGPGGIRLHSPTVAWHMRCLHQHFRTGSSLAPALRELSILVTAREHHSAFEWAAHAPQALRDGVDPAAIEAVRSDAPVTDLGEREALVITLGRQLLRSRRVDDAVFADALRLLGPSALVDLVSVMGLYGATASLLDAFDMQLPPAAEAVRFGSP